MATLLVAVWLAGCASHQTNYYAEGLPDNGAWTRIKFRFHWPESQSADFSYHLLIADQVVRPVVENPDIQLPLWRFHRRAARDDAGHQFSFIFFSDGDNAAKALEQVQSSPLFLLLLEQEIVKQVIFTDGRINGEVQIADTSDPDWPNEIMASWPWFIMGVSKSWLDLIDRLHDGEDMPSKQNLGQMLEYYRELNRALSAQWTEYGRHAYFHHINGIFGYEPVYLYETGQLHRF